MESSGVTVRRSLRRPRGGWRSGAILGLQVLVFGASAWGQGTLQRLSVDSEGNPIGGHCTFPIGQSSDGRVVTFWGPGSGSPWTSVYTHDRISGETRIVSVSSSGEACNNHCWSSAISADGTTVAFYGDATNLVPGDTNAKTDVFVHDRTTGVTTRVSVSSSGVQGDGYSYLPSLSETGRYVAFESEADNLVAGDVNGTPDVFVHDRSTQTTVLASVDSSGAHGDGYSSDAILSRDGRYLVFQSSSANFAAGDTNGVYDVFERDLLTGQTLCASVSSGGQLGNARSRTPAVSDDGRYVAFLSDASNLVTGDTNGVGDVFLHDFLTGATTRVSVDSTGAQVVADPSFYTVTLSGDARFVTFCSSGFSPAPTPVYQAIVRDRLLGLTRTISQTPAGQDGDRPTWAASISQDGRFVAFATDASDIVPHDGLFSFDVFSYDQVGDSPSIVRYCTSAPTSHGCTPTLSAVGVPRSASSGFTVNAQGAEGRRSGLFFYGVSGSQHAAFGSGAGTLCVRAPLQRTSVVDSGGTPGACDGALVLDWNAFLWTHPQVIGSPLVRGTTVWIQAWMREPTAPGGSTLSDALWFTVCP